jgi:hypothetical protein
VGGAGLDVGVRELAGLARVHRADRCGLCRTIFRIFARITFKRIPGCYNKDNIHFDKKR